MQKSFPRAPVNAANHAATIGGAPRNKQSDHLFADTTGQLIDKKSANQFQDKLEEEIEHVQWMMPLTGHSEKAGKA